MKNKIDEIIRLAKKEMIKEGSSGYLPDLIEAFEEMKETLYLKKNKFDSIKKRYSGLGKVITDDIRFSESELGSKMLQLLEDYLRR